MQDSILEKLQMMVERFEEVSALLNQSEIIADQNKFIELSKEYSELDALVESYSDYQSAVADQTAAAAMLDDEDVELRAMAKEELDASEEAIARLEIQLQQLLIPKDCNDEKNIFLEIRAGTGGDEAAIFVGDLYRMYWRYAERQHWRIEVLSEREGDHGGYREIITRIRGDNVYSQLKFESGAHRVQRVPETESQGRIHTSACTVAILPEADSLESIAINKADLRIDTYRASGSGGQHVNKTDSAIRITHLPSGIVVECQDERSQHKNKAKAMAVLQAKLNMRQELQQTEEHASTRKSLVGSGDRSERIRTYNYPQGRITDHRINLTLYKLDEIMQGDMSELLQSLSNEHQANQLLSLTEA